jgi:hypothetical protein
MPRFFLTFPRGLTHHYSSESSKFALTLRIIAVRLLCAFPLIRTVFELSVTCLWTPHAIVFSFLLCARIFVQVAQRTCRF